MIEKEKTNKIFILNDIDRGVILDEIKE